MRLIELEKKIIGLKIINDAAFENLKMLTTDSEDVNNLTFIYNPKYISMANEDESISSIITTLDIMKDEKISKEKGVILAENPKKTFYDIHNYLASQQFYWTKHQNKIAKSANVCSSAFIGEHSILIGENTVIEANVVIHPGVIIGNNVIIRSGSQIGGAGFQFLNSHSSVISVESAGRVLIEDNVEIQHNCCIDKGVFGGNTILKKDVKIDNFVHIAHDDVIGERTFITAGVKLSGRVVIGKDCWLGVNATVSNGITIGDNSKITLGSVVTRDVPGDTTVTGNFAIEHSKFMENLKKIR